MKPVTDVFLCQIILLTNGVLYFEIIIRGGWMILNFFYCSSPFCFFVNWLSLYFFLFVIKSSHIMIIIIVLFRLSSDKLVCFNTGFPLFSPKGLVMGFDSLLGSFCYSKMILHFIFMHLLSGYYYYDCNKKIYVCWGLCG